MILMHHPDVKGDSTVADHVDWIGIDSFQFGVGRGISSTTGGSDRDTSTPSFSEITLTKPTDISSTGLFAATGWGKAPATPVLIHFIQTGGTSASQVYMTFTLGSPLLSGYSLSSGGDRPSESISINYVKIEITYTQFKDGGAGVDADPKGFDLKTGVPT
jgi:type VI secretion system secreted protein Hcp